LFLFPQSNDDILNIPNNFKYFFKQKTPDQNQPRVS
jgi:hypothetical protein